MPCKLTDGGQIPGSVCGASDTVHIINPSAVKKKKINAGQIRHLPSNILKNYEQPPIHTHIRV